MSHNPHYEVRIFDYTSTACIPCGTTYNCQISLTQNFYGTGSFELTIPLADPCAVQFQKHRFVLIGRRFYGFIVGLRRTADQNGDLLIITGTDLNGLLERRITMPKDYGGSNDAAGYDAVTGASETVIKHFVRNNLVLPSQPDRIIKGFTIAPDLQRGLPTDKYMSRYEPLSEVVYKVGQTAKLGAVTSLDLQQGRILFDVTMGTNRTVSQSDVRPVVFSVNRQTMLSMEYIDNEAGLKNAFYATMSGAKYADEALTMTFYRPEQETAPPSGVARIETHMDISAQTPASGQEYAELKRLALINATDMVGVSNFTCEVNFARLSFGKDYFLGDLVTVQHLGWGVTRDIEIVGMTIECTGQGERYTATFGKQKPTLVSAVKQIAKGG